MKDLFTIMKEAPSNLSAAQKPKSWVAQRTTHGESLGAYFFMAGPWLLLYVPKSVMHKHAQIDVIRPSSLWLKFTTSS